MKLTEWILIELERIHPASDKPLTKLLEKMGDKFIYDPKPITIDDLKEVKKDGPKENN